MDRKPDPWQTNEARPFLMIGDVSVSVLGDHRYRIDSPSGVEVVEGFAEARKMSSGDGRPGLIEAIVVHADISSAPSSGRVRRERRDAPQGRWSDGEGGCQRDDALVARAAKRADWAGDALEQAADDLENVGDDASSLSGLAETVQDEAEHVARLAKDIESQRSDMDREPGHAAWGTGTAEPFLRIGPVRLWALGGQRFRVQSPSRDEEVEGFEEARRLARELAALD
jgi:hypothetical protein